MTLQADKLANWQIPEGRQTYTGRDSILYALGIGCGMDPTDEAELQYVYEDGQKAFPAMAHVLGYPGFWLKDVDLGFDWRRMLHGEQTMQLVTPIPVTGSVIGRTRVQGVYDKGPGRDAVLVTVREIQDANTGGAIGSVTSTILIRGEGGFGGPASPPSVLKAAPDRQPEITVDLPTSPQAALIYRLSGDTNPLHASPQVASVAGFPRPILHGLSTLGVATRAVVRACLGSDGSRLREFGARFSAPVFPGETIRTEIWTSGDSGSFRCRVVERDLIVLSNGFYRF